MTRLGRLLIGAALALAPSVAMACSCDDPNSFNDAEIEKAARYLIDGGFVIAEVERIENKPAGPLRYRIIRQSFGPTTGAELSVASNAVQMPDGQWLVSPQTSCDSPSGIVGTRRTMVFRPIRTEGERPSCGVLPKGLVTEWRLAGLCTGSLIENSRILARARTLAMAQPGVSRSSRPLSSSR